MIAHKTCSKCGQDKPLVEFHLQPSGRLGRRADCIECCTKRRLKAAAHTKEATGKWPVQHWRDAKRQKWAKLAEQAAGKSA
jgi:hypothetical protein